jgi:hypothetical protein
MSDGYRRAPDPDGLLGQLQAAQGGATRDPGSSLPTAAPVGPAEPLGLAQPLGRPAARAAPAPRADLWRSTLQWIVAALITALLAFFTYMHDGWVPLLSYFDLGVHEFGHLLTMWAPELVCWAAGSFLQVAAPLGLAAYFLHRGDRFAVILMVAWAAESLNNVSVYIADARVMLLPLFGDDGSGAGHDWHNILTRLDLLESTSTIARFAHVGSMLLFVVAFGLAAFWFVRSRDARNPAA